jgi:ABC-2 type transport system ATP-binding protein
MRRGGRTKRSLPLRRAWGRRTLTAMIRLEEVTKEYAGPVARATSGRVLALDSVSLHLAPGTALGIVGPNGAGKSTLIRLLLGFLRATRGTVSIDGMAPRRYVERHGIAYVSETIAISPTWTVRGAMRTFASLGGAAHEPVDETMGLLGIDTLADRRVSSLSKGNLQRLAIAQALLCPRRVMILDEPTTGLDPEWVMRLRDLVAEWRAADPLRVLVIASHNLDEVKRLADRVAVLDQGHVRELIDLRGSPQATSVYRVEVQPGERVPQAVRAVFPHAVDEEGMPFTYRVEVADVAELNRRVAELIGRGILVRALAPERVSLEERYRATRVRAALEDV